MSRILILSDHRLFAAGIEHLLRQTPTLKIWSSDPGLENTLDQIERVDPDVIIVDCTSWGGIIPQTVMHGWAHRPKQTVIKVDLNSNDIIICHQEQRTVTRPEDLTNVLMV